MIDDLRTRLAAAEQELAELDRRRAEVDRRRAALEAFVTDARKAVSSYEALEASQRKGLLPRPDLTVEQLVQFLRTQTEGVVAIDEVVERFGAGHRAVTELARKRAAQGLFVVDTATKLVKLL